MIYRVDFTAVSTSSQFISPVIFGVIVDKIFELVDEKKARKIVDEIISSDILISDAYPIIRTDNGIERLFTKIGLSSFDEFENGDLSLKDRRKLSREMKKKAGQQLLIAIDHSGNMKETNRNIVSAVEVYRIGIQVNRHTDTSQEGILFYHQEFIFPQNQPFSIYIKCDNEKLIEIIEKCFSIIELTGFGPDVSIGKGKIRFFKHENKILIRDEQVERYFPQNIDGKEEFVNISSTIFSPQITEICKFKTYLTFRYDSKGYFTFKPPYFCAAKGAVVVPISSKLNLVKEYQGKLLYTCIFPLKL
ncbi:protein of unknown function DUF324 [Caldicellulosiruptor owensensis OL]|uniref:CRISPR system Cms protein Csm4 n=1 Tax=Caldicellulosiruptor owensensis (strain ATCC 700167 / DSM 13100 / OL) TaxID=632518 RepID=E4Q733_CALOW|nr:hypothetical protein [Caldicellulosiruptor owensensis]ADQ05713.1 protein of unknown function DUF324 [Caldicellulosiruptor owensensis OL]